MTPDDTQLEALLAAAIPPLDDEATDELMAAPPLPEGLAERALARALDSSPRVAQSIGTEVPQVSSGPPLKVAPGALCPDSAPRRSRWQRSLPWVLAGLAGVGLGAAAVAPLGRLLRAGAEAATRAARADRAEALRRQRRYREALTDVEGALESAPESPELQFLKAHILLDAGDLLSARLAVDRGLQRHRGSAYGLGLRAHLRFKADEVEGARADIEAAIALDPSCYYPYLVRGAIREGSDPAGARSDFQLALERAPYLAEPHVRLGRVCQQMGDLTPALASYDTAMAIDGDDYRTLCNRGTIYRMLERYDDALRDHDRAVALKPKDGSLRFQRSKARWIKLRKANVPYTSSRWDGVLEDLDLALEDLRVAGDAYGRRGYIRYKRKEYQGAMADYETAINLGPTRDKVYVWYGYRALLHTVLGRYGEGLRDGERFLELAPGSHENRPAVQKAVQRCRAALAENR